jgi:hypothetical protein
MEDLDNLIEDELIPEPKKLNSDKVSVEESEDDLEDGDKNSRTFYITYTKNKIQKIITLCGWATLTNKRGSLHTISRIMAYRFPIKAPQPIQHNDLVRYMKDGLAVARAVFMSYDVRDLAKYGYMPRANDWPKRLIGLEANTPSEAFLREIEYRNSANYAMSPLVSIAPNLKLLLYINADGTIVAEQSDTIREDDQWLYCIQPAQLWFVHQFDRERRPIVYSSNIVLEEKFRAQNYINKLLHKIQEIEPQALEKNKFVNGFDAAEEMKLRHICKHRNLNYNWTKDQILRGKLDYDDFCRRNAKENSTLNKKDLDQILL